MKKTKVLLACLVFAFLVGCGSNDNRQSFELGTLEIVDHGAVTPTSYVTHIFVDSTGHITAEQDPAAGDGPSYLLWEYQMTPEEKSLVEKECTDANILYRGDVTLPDGADPCIGAGNLDFHAVSKSGLENEFTVSGDVRCPMPAALNTLYATIMGWEPEPAPAYPVN